MATTAEKLEMRPNAQVESFTTANGAWLVAVDYDQHAERPRCEHEQFGTIYTFDRYGELSAYADSWAESDYRSRIDSTTASDFAKEADAHELFMASFAENDVVLPVYKYEHSGVALSTQPFTCSWDSGQIGIIAMSADEVRKRYNVKRISKKLRQRVERELSAEIALLSQWADGEVYEFCVYHWDKNDCCYGLRDIWGDIYSKDYKLQPIAQDLLAEYGVTEPVS